MNLQKSESIIEGCYTLKLPKQEDQRGFFVKCFHADFFKDSSEMPIIKEQYYSSSHKNVFRGMHFQLPPYDVLKLVFCVQGQVLDFVADLRKNSKTYGQCIHFELSCNNPTLLVIPSGLAHGFLTLSDKAILHYMVSEVYQPEFDSGIHYSSFQSIQLPPTVILSNRDQGFAKLIDFDSPF